MRIAHRRGHNFKVVGARHFIKEEIEGDKINFYINEYLDSLKTKHIDCSSDSVTQSEDLKHGVKKCNDFNSDLFLSIHFNSATFKGSNFTNEKVGSEVWCYDNNNKYALEILSRFQELGFKNRGVKKTNSLYEIKNTKCIALIIEICFVNSKDDVETYKRVGAKTIAKVIVESILNIKIHDNDNKKGFYRVITSSNVERLNAENELKKLTSLGFKNTFIEFKGD